MSHTPKREPSPELSTPKMYYIWDTRTYVGDSVMWWRHNGAGYTINLEEAGEYTEEQTKGLDYTQRPIPVETAKAAASTHVRADRLRTALSASEPR